MTTFLEDLQATLKPLAAGGAWFQMNEAQPPVFPFIVYTRVISTTNNSLQGPSALQNTRVQVDVYARSAAQAETLADSVRTAMAAGPWAASVSISTEDFYDFEVRVFRIASDFSIWASN